MHRLEARSFESSSKTFYSGSSKNQLSVFEYTLGDIWGRVTAEIWFWHVDRNLLLNNMEGELRISDSKEWERLGESKKPPPHASQTFLASIRPFLLKGVFSCFFWETYSRNWIQSVSYVFIYQLSTYNALCTHNTRIQGWASLLSYPRKDERLIEETDTWNRGQNLFKYWVSFSH